ncbi:MAG TPA: MFS transporter [Propionibacteriaceae bacterium]|nr:MFS transporter [Propionibacteriaceae bacterium]
MTTTAQAGAATRATYLAFIGSGFAFASWASRIPQVRDRLQLDSSELGLVLLAVAAGSLLSMPLSGPVVTRFGSRRTVAAMAALLAAALVVVAVGYVLGMLPVLVGLFLLGVANGSWDVAMNVQGARVERLIGQAIMPRFHAGFSIGTVAGALLGAAMVALEVSPTLHLAGVAVIIGAVVPLGVRTFVADDDPADAASTSMSEGPTGAARTLAAWRERRTLLVGLIVLAFAFAEGTGNDWIGIALIDGYSLPPAIGTLGFALFLAAMTAGRWYGPPLLDRYGRVAVLRLLSVLSVVGLSLFVFGQLPWVAFVGAVLWGAGISLGFPVGMSAGADEPAMAAARVSVIASIGYCAFLAGPPLIGFLGDQITVLKALTAVAVLLGLAGLITGNVRPPAAT